MEGQTHRSTGQKREPRNRPTQIRSIDVRQRCESNSVEKKSSLQKAELGPLPTQRQKKNSLNVSLYIKRSKRIIHVNETHEDRRLLEENRGEKSSGSKARQ